MGLCPECLIKSGFPTGVATDSESATQSAFLPPSLEEMSRLFPQLEILELIGKGGMGAVYKARQKQLNRIVALKILPPSIGSDPAFADRFTREAQALAQLNHPGIVSLHEFGQAGGLHYAVVDGGSESLTENGKVLGTPNYLSPEQIEHPSEVDHRADIYALGVVFYQMLTGELPGKQLQPPSRKVRVDVRLDEIVLHALEKEPDRRYQHASVLKSDVETIASPANPWLQPANQPSVSGAAVAGACLAPFFFISMIYWDFGSSGGTQAGLGVIATSLGWIALLGTTLLGWVAVSQIRRSERRLSGMGLAIADGLVLPLPIWFRGFPT